MACFNCRARADRECQVLKVGMVADVTCISKPWTIVPTVVTSVQDSIAAGLFRGGEQLIEAQHGRKSEHHFVFMEPIYKGGLEGVTPGSSCVANAYTSNHDMILRTTRRGRSSALRCPSANDATGIFCTPFCCASKR